MKVRRSSCGGRLGTVRRMPIGCFSPRGPRGVYPRRTETGNPKVRAGASCAPLIPMSSCGSSPRDDARQSESADRWVETGAWVSILALAETAWVLSTVYGRSPGEIASVIEILLNHKDLTLQDSDAVAAALKCFRKRPALGFSDCLLLELARKAGHLPLGTFDRELSKLDGAEKV